MAASFQLWQWHLAFYSPSMSAAILSTPYAESPTIETPTRDAQMKVLLSVAHSHFL